MLTPSQGYMKVARHDGVITTSCCDGGNIHLQKFRWVSGTVVLLWKVWAELGRPCHRAELIRQRSTAHPSHRGAHLYPGVHRRLSCCHVQISIEVAALNVEMALSRPLHGDAGVLTRARLRLSSARRSSVRSPLTVGERTDADALPWRRW